MPPPSGRAAGTRRLAHIPALDGVRGLAVLVVLSGHFFGWPNAHFGVEIFFVLSGFLITALLLQERAESGRVSLTAFYRRRALRLVPALVVALAGYLALSAALAAAGADVPSLLTSLGAVAASGLYVANLVQAFGEPLPPGLRHMWSLGIEEQFYVVWPLVLVAALSLRARWRTIALCLGAAIVLVVAHRLRLHLDGATPARTTFAPDTRADALLVGCLAGVAFHAGLRVAAPVLRAASAVGAATVGVVLVLAPTAHTTLLLLWPFFAAAVGVLLFRAACDGGSGTARFLAARPLIYLGRISYGLYLWHLILLWTPPENLPVPGGLRLALAFAAAELSYRYVERPFLRRKRRAARPPARVEAVPAPATA